MTAAVEQVPLGDIVVPAQIEEQHRDGRRCAQCGPDGCELAEWARPRLAAHRAERAWS